MPERSAAARRFGSSCQRASCRCGVSAFVCASASAVLTELLSSCALTQGLRPGLMNAAASRLECDGCFASRPTDLADRSLACPAGSCWSSHWLVPLACSTDLFLLASSCLIVGSFFARGFLAGRRIVSPQIEQAADYVDHRGGFGFFGGRLQRGDRGVHDFVDDAAG